MNPGVFEGYVDRAGERDLYVSHGDNDVPVCFDVRKALKLFPALQDHPIVYDVKMLCGHDGELSRLVKTSEIPSKEEYLGLERRFSASTRAISGAKMDVDEIPLRDLVPAEIRGPYMWARVKAIREIFGSLSEEKLEEYRERVWPTFRVVSEVESAGVKIDVLYVESMLKRNDLAVHETKFLRHILGNTKDGFARTKINPVGTRTWRLGVDGGLNCMAIPHGVCRRAVVSRFEGGSILTLDFNAIDYRCIVTAVDDPDLNAFYLGKRDFHWETAKLFGDPDAKLREQTKKMTYPLIYGGSMDTLQKHTGLPLAELVRRLATLRRHFQGIIVFGEELATVAQQAGFVVTPGGYRVVVSREDHVGKVIGLYAQTYSSSVFMRALKDVLSFLRGKKSRVVFTVHDEIVVDVHPDEEVDLPGSLQSEMEASTGFVVKRKTGRSYGECTDG